MDSLFSFFLLFPAKDTTLSTATDKSLRVVTLVWFCRELSEHLVQCGK